MSSINIFAVTLLLFIAIHSIKSYTRNIDDCQLLIVGGSTAAFGAIISASKFLNTRVCLLEPTDWVGGQLIAELLSAPDFVDYVLKDGNFTLNVSHINLQPENRNPLFTEMLNVLGDTGHCTVSPWCFLPKVFHDEVVVPKVNNTRIFYNTFIKRVIKDASGRRITQVDVIQRTSRQTEERCRFLSEELPDWYSQDDSAWFTKTQLTFTNISFFIEDTSWGEVLVLSYASYLQGLMEQFDGDISGIGNPLCGQEITIDYLEQLRETPEDEPPNPLPKPIGGGNCSLDAGTWEERWVFRRANTSASDYRIAVNDISIRNWLRGNKGEGVSIEKMHQNDGQIEQYLSDHRQKRVPVIIWGNCLIYENQVDQLVIKVF